MSMIQVPILFPEDLYKALKLWSKTRQRPMADLIRRAVKKEFKKTPYCSPLLEMAKKATGPKKGPKKNYSLMADKVLYGKKHP